VRLEGVQVGLHQREAYQGLPERRRPTELRPAPTRRTGLWQIVMILSAAYVVYHDVYR